MLASVNHEKMNVQDQYWEIQKSIAEQIAKEQSPSVTRLNEAIVEEFGFLPEFELIEFFIESIKKNNKTPTSALDPKQQLAYAVAMSGNPSVPKFCNLFRSNFKELPPNDILKYFLTTVRSCQLDSSDTDQQFFLAQKVAKSSNPCFKNLCETFEKSGNKPPSFDVIDYFISQITN